MRFSLKSQQAFSLVEVLVASMVFILAVAGVLATLSAVRQPASTAERELKAAIVGQQVLEEMRVKVDANDWNAANLAETGGTPQTFTKTVNGVDYEISYTVVEDPVSHARQVNMTVNWPD